MSSISEPSSLWIKCDEPLKPYTTFKVGGPARYFIPAESADDLRSAVAFAAEQELPLFTLGGGSNILVSDRGYDGVVLHPVFRGVKLAGADAESAVLGVSAGEPWDEVVRHAAENGWWGIENLSHIPGQAGAALVQNIGAYGQQVSDVVQSAHVLEMASGELRTLSAGDCGFGYRRSIFNTSARGKLIIVGVTLRLKKHASPLLNYPDVQTYFQRCGISQPSIGEIRDAIIAIRDSKFPFPREERGGNAGSFFKNMTLTAAQYDALRQRIERNFSPRELERLVGIRNRFPVAEGIKIPTAFLIDICGLRGHRLGGAQVNETQPLVLLNQGGATAHDVVALAQHIRKTVLARTGLAPALEPELVGFSQQELDELSNIEAA
jgi:UDP-N-acetylmuramate dehydrogenase